MTAGHPKIRTAVQVDFDQLTSVSVHAFQNDPLAVWLYPKPDQRRRNHEAMFKATLQEPGEQAVIETDDSVEAVAIWRPVIGPVDSGTPPGTNAQADSLFAAIAAAAPTTRCWSLAFLGARTPGKGLGTALVLHRLERLAGLVALWTANEAKLRFYQHFRFQVSSRVDGDGISVWWLNLWLSRSD